MTQTERRALKEHINILDCVQRERSEAEQCVCVQTSVHIVCMYVGKGDVSVGEMSSCSCLCANADGLVPVTLVSLIFSRWDTVSGCNTHTHIHRDTHAAKV